MLRRLLAPLVLGALLPAPAAKAFIYWVNPGQHAISRADGNGRHRRPLFVNGAWFACGLAVARGHIFWANYRSASGRPGTTIGRAGLNGRGVDNVFIRGARRPCWLAASSSHLYWANGDGWIGTARLDGTHVRRRLIYVANQGQESRGQIGAVSGLAVRGRFLYWSDPWNDTIGSSGLNGGGADDDIITLPQGTHPQGIAIRGDFIYWAGSGGTIGRARLDGSDMDPTFVRSGPLGASSLATTTRRILWTWSSFDPFGAGIGRANLDGTAANARFIKGVGGEGGAGGGIAVAPG